MSGETYFLQPVKPLPDSEQNFANASGNATFFEFSHPASNSSNDADVKEIVKGGEAFANVISNAVALNDPALSDLAADISTGGEGGAYEIAAGVKLKIVSSYDVGAQENFSFDFFTDVSVEAKEIENPQKEYSLAKSRTAFLVLDTTQSAHNPKIVDFFNLSARLISSERRGRLKLASSDRIEIISSERDKDINGNNGIDFVEGDVFGAYSRTFKTARQLTVIEVSRTKVDLLGDTLIGNLGNGVRYGTLWEDHLKGTRRSDKIYASLGDDWVEGKKGNDILEGGLGRDTLKGGSGADKLHGGLENDRLLGGNQDDILVGGQGDDKLKGGRGSDDMSGNEGVDRFIFNAVFFANDAFYSKAFYEGAYGGVQTFAGEGKSKDSVDNNLEDYTLFFEEDKFYQVDYGSIQTLKKKTRYKNGHDIIRDFEVGSDKVVAKGWELDSVEAWFQKSVSQGQLSDTPEGALFKGIDGTLLFENVSVASLSASDFVFA